MTKADLVEFYKDEEVQALIISLIGKGISAGEAPYEFPSHTAIEDYLHPRRREVNT